MDDCACGRPRKGCEYHDPEYLHVPYYGAYSPSAAEVFGTVIYEHESGAEVEVTIVDRDPQFTNYLWPDVKSVGRVVRYLRQARPVKWRDADGWRP